MLTCPLTDIQVNKCPVRTCMYWTKKRPGNCLGPDAVGEPLDSDDPLLRMSRGYTTKLGKESVERIKQALLVNNYLEWCAEKFTWQDYPFVIGYRNKRLRAYVSELASTTFPYTLTSLPWNIGLVCATVYPKWLTKWNRPLDNWPISEELSQEIRSHFRRAAEKAASRKWNATDSRPR